jgi:SNF2 family DNA or RNA helicase
MTFTFGTPNKPWQQRAFDQTAEKKTYALLYDPGMGKTKSALDTAAHAWQLDEVDLLLALAPNGAHRVWPEQAATHLHHVSHDAAFYRTGTVNNPIKRVMARHRREGLKVVAVNLESLSHPSGLAVVRELMAGQRTMMVVDESQKIRTPGARRTRAIIKLGEQAVMRRILSGTVVIKGYENLYSQYRFLHPGIIGEPTYTSYKAKYCVMVGTYNQIVGYKNVDELMARIGIRTFMAYESEMGLEPPVVVSRPVELSQEQRRIYNQLRETYLAELASGAIVEAPLAITRLQKFQQILGGHISHGAGEWESLACPRLSDAVDVIAAAPSKILVWAQWQPDIIQLSSALSAAGIKHVTYYGGNKGTTNADNLERFKGDASYHAFVATPMSGGTGLTINEAKRTLNYTHSFDTEHVWQSRKRNHRLGQDTQIHVTNLVAPGTVDSKILASQNRKEGLAAIMRDPTVFARWLREDEEEEE